MFNKMKFETPFIPFGKSILNEINLDLKIFRKISLKFIKIYSDKI